MPARIPARVQVPMSGARAPRSYPSQVDPTTCGIAALSVLAARSKLGRGYLTADRASVERAQKRLHAIAARVGVPWPQALGTSPWALARLAEAATGLRYRLVLPGGAMRTRIGEALARGHDVPLYTGGSRVPLSGLIPRHVVLVLAESTADGRWEVFEPSSGKVMPVDPEDLLSGGGDAAAARGHWRRVLLALVPEAAAPLEASGPKRGR